MPSRIPTERNRPYSGGLDRLAETPLRILYLQPCASFGGAERQAATMIPLLPDWGIEVVPLVGPNTVICRWLDEQDVRGTILSRDFPGAWPKVTGWRRMGLPARYARCRRRVAEQVEAILRQGAIDLVFAAMPFSWAAATAPARALGVPVVWRAGGTIIKALERPLLRTWSAFNRPDLLVCCGEAVKRVFSPLIPAPAEVVRNGVDLHRFRPERADLHRFRPKDGKMVVGFAARLAPEKRPEDFIRMAGHLHKRHPDVKFLVAGDGSRKPAYEAMARELGLEQHMRFLGFVGDMCSFYAACDIVVLPSQYEGCPNVVLEAMAMQKALVVSNTDATTEVVTHGRDALVYDLGNTEAFSDAVAQLIEKPELRERLARAARERVRRDFDARNAVVRLASVLRAVAMPQDERLPAARRALLSAPDSM